MTFKENMGAADRVIRAYTAVAFVVLFFHGMTSGIFGYLSLVLAIAFLANAIFGVCVFYQLLGIGTKWKMKKS